MVEIVTKLAHRAWRLAAQSKAGRLVLQKDGAAAVEFGLVAAPFLALVASSSRLIMTGQAQTQNYDATAFKNAVCAQITGLFNCQNGVYVDVRMFTSFSSVTMPSPVNSQGNFQNDFTYQPGGPGDIVVVRLFYLYPVYVSLLGFNLTNVNSGTRLLAATSTFRNEPYSN